MQEKLTKNKNRRQEMKKRFDVKICQMAEHYRLTEDTVLDKICNIYY